jgi:hypothetical protein
VPRCLQAEQRPRDIDREQLVIVGSGDLDDGAALNSAALLIRMSSLPSIAMASAKPASMLSCRVTSSAMAWALDPAPAAAFCRRKVDVGNATSAPSAR